VTRDELVAELRLIADNFNGGDVEAGHLRADQVLLAFIDNQAVTDAFDAIDRWYS
jgi:hypothetical protein